MTLIEEAQLLLDTNGGEGNTFERHEVVSGLAYKFFDEIRVSVECGADTAQLEELQTQLFALENELVLALEEGDI